MFASKKLSFIFQIFCSARMHPENYVPVSNCAVQINRILQRKRFLLTNQRAAHVKITIFQSTMPQYAIKFGKWILVSQSAVCNTMEKFTKQRNIPWLRLLIDWHQIKEK